MGIFSRRRLEAGAAERAAQAAGVPSDITGLIDDDDYGRVSRSEALSVPAVTGAVQILAGAACALPLRRFDSGGNALEPGTFIAHPEPDEQLPLSLTIRRTVADMALEGVGYWRVLLRDYSGRPLAVVKLDPLACHPNQEYVSGVGLVTKTWQVDDLVLPPGDVLAFYGPVEGGWCRAGARTIRTSLTLEKAAKRYADEPVPSVVLKNRSGVDLPAAQVTAILDEWQKGRKPRSTAYLNTALDADTLGFDARSLQLVEGRQQAVLEVARLANLPSGMLASAAAGTSLTYSNVESERLKTLGAIMPYLVAIESRLSAEDCTPRGQSVRFDLQALQRPDTATVVKMIQDLVPLGLLEDDEARAYLGLPNRAGSPSRIPTPGNAPTAAAPPAPLALRSTALAAALEGPAGAVGALEGREVSGLVVPWGVPARVQGSPEPVVFLRGSLKASAGVRLILHHDMTRPVGRPLEYSDDDDGLRARFYLGSSSTARDAALDVSDGVLDGFSVGVDVEDGYRLEGTVYVTAAALREVSLVTLPAYSAARVGAAQMKGATVPKLTTDRPAALLALEAQSQPPPAAPTLPPTLPPGAVALGGPATPAQASPPPPAGSAAPVAPPPAPGPVTGDPGAPPAPPPAPTAPAAPVHLADVLAALGAAPGTIVTVGREESPYGDLKHSFFADLRAAAYGDTEARERAEKFRRQLGEYIADYRAADGSTTNSPQIIPPKWGGEWYVDEIDRERPVVDTFSSATITDNRPVPIPAFASTNPAELVANHVEGQPPAQGNVVFRQVMVTPKAKSGTARVSRELLDASPTLTDRSVSRALRLSYARVTEQAAAAAIIAGSSLGVAANDAVSYEHANRVAIGAMPTTRFSIARRLLAPAGAYGALVDTDLDDGRPLVPFVGYEPTRSSSVAFAAYGSMAIAGVPLFPAWALSAGLVVASPGDAMTFESSLLEFKFTEKDGPELIDYSVWGYFDAVVLEAIGVVRIPYTGAGAADEPAARAKK